MMEHFITTFKINKRFQSELKQQQQHHTESDRRTDQTAVES